ncbi:MAG: hypothetical protein Q8K99_05690 [Actinomycetota bacterium]|nr:hypothetical protein [Actinomycetota bacterium]
MRQLGVAAIVLGGLYAVVQGVIVIANNAWAFETISDTGQLVWMVAIGACGLLLVGGGVWLVSQRESLAERWFKDSDVRFDIDGSAALRVGVALLGLVLLMSAVPRLVGALGNWFAMVTQSADFEGLLSDSAQRWSVAASAVIGLLQASFGAFFVSRSQSVATAIWSWGQAKEVVEVRESVCPSCGTAFSPSDYRDMASARCSECGSRLEE